MLDKNLLYVLTILESIEKIFIYTEGFSDAERFFFANDQINFNATVNLLIAIGEDSKKLDSNVKDKYQTVNWKSILSLRNELSHNYRGIDPDLIWDIVKNYLNDLKFVCIEIFKSLIKTTGTENKLDEILDPAFYAHIQYLKDSF